MISAFKQKTHTLQRILFTIFFVEIKEVASCTFYNANTFSFEHWNCPEHQICCIYYGAKSCCREKQAYMNTGYGSKGDQGNHHGGSHHFDWSGNIVYYLKIHYTEVLVVLSMLFIFVMLVICCLQWKKNMEDEAEEEELFRINQMIAISEGRGTGGSLYRPQPLCPLRHGEEPSENTTIASQQPPSYDSVSKDNDQSEAGAAHLTAPPPPYKP